MEPVSATLWGKHDNPVINISEVYLNEHGEIFANGYEQSYGILEKGFAIYPEQYSRQKRNFTFSSTRWNLLSAM